MTLSETQIDKFCQSPLVSIFPSNRPSDAATPIFGERLSLLFLRPLALSRRLGTLWCNCARYFPERSDSAVSCASGRFGEKRATRSDIAFASSDRPCVAKLAPAASIQRRWADRHGALILANRLGQVAILAGRSSRVRSWPWSNRAQNAARFRNTASPSSTAPFRDSQIPGCYRRQRAESRRSRGWPPSRIVQWPPADCRAYPHRWPDPGWRSDRRA